MKQWDAKLSRKVLHTVITVVATLVVVGGGAFVYSFFKHDTTTQLKNNPGPQMTSTVKATNAADVELPSGAKPFDSGYLNPGRAYTHLFRTPGTYRYVCTLHEVQHMIGQVIVKP